MWQSIKKKEKKNSSFLYLLLWPFLVMGGFGTHRRFAPQVRVGGPLWTATTTSGSRWTWAPGSRWAPWLLRAATAAPTGRRATGSCTATREGTGSLTTRTATFGWVRGGVVVAVAASQQKKVVDSRPEIFQLFSLHGLPGLHVLRVLPLPPPVPKNAHEAKRKLQIIRRGECECDWLLVTLRWTGDLSTPSLYFRPMAAGLGYDWPLWFGPHKQGVQQKWIHKQEAEWLKVIYKSGGIRKLMLTNALLINISLINPALWLHYFFFY